MTGGLVCRVLAATAFITFATGVRAEMPLQTLYTLQCSGCHGAKGLGVPEAGIPNLNDAGRYVRTDRGRQYLIQVPGLSQSRLDDATVARLLNWVLQEFSANRLPADFRPYTAGEVTHFRSDKASDAKTRRDAILTELRSQGLWEPAKAGPSLIEAVIE
jgi:hypothetical protein